MIPIHIISQGSHNPMKYLGTAIIPILQRRKQRHREVKRLAQDHTAGIGGAGIQTLAAWPQSPQTSPLPSPSPIQPSAPAPGPSVCHHAQVLPTPKLTPSSDPESPSG